MPRNIEIGMRVVHKLNPAEVLTITSIDEIGTMSIVRYNNRAWDYLVTLTKDDSYYTIVYPISANKPISNNTKYTEIELCTTYEFDKLCIDLDYNCIYSQSATTTTMIPIKYYKIHIGLDGVIGYYHFNNEVKQSKLPLKKVLCDYLDCKGLYLDIQKDRQPLDYKDFSFKEYELVNGYDSTDISSCMRNNGYYFSYLDSNTTAKFIKVKDKDGYEVARFIQWYYEDVGGLPEDCKGLIDRIYPSDNHKIVDMVKAYAKDNNYMHRTEQNYNTTKLVTYNGVSEEVQLKVWVGEGIENEEVPYMDTFKYYRDGYLYNFPIKNYSAILDSTEGNTFTDNGTCTCEECGDRHPIDDMYYISDDDTYVCEDCYNDYYGRCDCCGERYHKDGLVDCEDTHNIYCDHCRDRGSITIVYSEYENRYYEEDYVYSELDEDYYSNDRSDLVYSEYSDDYSINECGVNVIINDSGDTEKWFECEAEDNAYEVDDKYYIDEETYRAIEGEEDDED